MIFYILDRQENIIGTVTNEGEQPSLFSAKMTEELSSTDTLEFSVVNGEYNDILQEENYVLFKDEFNEFRLFIIKEITGKHSESLELNIYCEDSSVELLDTVYEFDEMGNSFTTATALSKVLAGSRWQVGEVDNYSVTSFPNETKNKTLLAVVQAVREVWTLQLRFRIVVKGNKIVGRYIDMKKSIGSDIGKRFEYTKDIESIERTVSTAELKTAVIPIGGKPEKEKTETSTGEDGEEQEEQPIDIKGVEWSTPANPVNKPLGQNYIEIETATQQWGYKREDGTMSPRFIYYENTELTDPERLMEFAYRMILSASVPTVNYKLDVLDLYALTGDTEYSHEAVRLGDTVSVIDKEFTPAIALISTIITKETDLLERANSKIELGTPKRNMVDKQSINEIDEKINYMIGTGLNDLQSSVRDLSKDFVEFQKQYNLDEIGFNWVRNSNFNNGLKYWELDNASELVPAEGIAYFDKVGDIAGNGYIMQTFNNADSKKLLNNNVTLSAFVKGSGKFNIQIMYKVPTSTMYKTVYWESESFTCEDWKRYTFKTALRVEAEETTDEMIVISFNSDVESHVTGFMLNLGLYAGAYTLNNADKYGKGYYDQIKAVNNAEFKSGVGYVYLEEEDGLWVYDKPTDQVPMKVTALKGGMLGIGKWNLQTQQWDMNTFIDGDSVNASCINTGCLTADLVKAGTLSSIDGSVAIDMESGAFRLGGSNGNTAEITNNHVQVKHNDGSYSEMSADGFLNVIGSTKNMYHHLLYMGDYTCLSEETVTIQLPDEFKGKKFKVVTSVKRINTYYDVYSYQAPILSFYAHADVVDYEKGQISVYASVRAWDKSGFGGEGVLIGDSSIDKQWIKPTVAYWVVA